MTKVSFCLLETDKIIIKIKEVADEYQIPVNSAIKVYFNNVEKEIKSLKEKIEELKERSNNHSYNNIPQIQPVIKKPPLPKVISDPPIQNVSLQNNDAVQSSENLANDETLVQENKRELANMFGL